MTFYSIIENDKITTNEKTSREHNFWRLDTTESLTLHWIIRLIALKGCLTVRQRVNHTTRSRLRPQLKLTEHHLAAKTGVSTQRLSVLALYILHWGAPFSGKSLRNSFPKTNHWEAQRLYFLEMFCKHPQPDLPYTKNILYIILLKHQLRYYNIDFIHATFDLCRSTNIWHTGIQVLQIKAITFFEYFGLSEVVISISWLNLTQNRL